LQLCLFEGLSYKHPQSSVSCRRRMRLLVMVRERSNVVCLVFMLSYNLQSFQRLPSTPDIKIVIESSYSFSCRTAASNQPLFPSVVLEAWSRSNVVAVLLCSEVGARHTGHHVSPTTNLNYDSVRLTLTSPVTTCTGTSHLFADIQQVPVWLSVPNAATGSSRRLFAFRKNGRPCSHRTCIRTKQCR
jgi:hypothetical protein